MKKLILILLFVPLVSFGQTSYCDGWDKGYEKGLDSCLQVGIAPICPIPEIGSSSYADGFGMGYAKALKKCREAKKSNINDESSASNSPYNRKIYGREPRPFVPNYDLFVDVIKKRQKVLLEENKMANKINDFIKKWNSRYNPVNNQKALQQVNLIINYYNQLSNLTSLPQADEKLLTTLPDGTKVMGSEVFVVIDYKKTKRTGREKVVLNDRGKRAYSAKAFYNYNKRFNSYEIFQIMIDDPSYPPEDVQSIYNRNHKWYKEHINNLIKDGYPCASLNIFDSSDFGVEGIPVLINSNGRAFSFFRSKYIQSLCYSRIGLEETKTTDAIYVYFIKDLENYTNSKN